MHVAGGINIRTYFVYTFIYIYRPVIVIVIVIVTMTMIMIMIMIMVILNSSDKHSKTIYNDTLLITNKTYTHLMILLMIIYKYIYIYSMQRHMVDPSKPIWHNLSTQKAELYREIKRIFLGTYIHIYIERERERKECISLSFLS